MHLKARLGAAVELKFAEIFGAKKINQGRIKVRPRQLETIRL
jgi:hypothetical protein